MSKDILEDTRELDTLKIIKLTLNLQPILKAFHPNIWISTQPFHEQPLNQDVFLEKLSIETTPFSFWIYMTSSFPEVLNRLLLVLLLFALFRAQALRKLFQTSFWKAQEAFRKKYKGMKSEHAQIAKELNQLSLLKNLLKTSGLQQRKLFKEVMHHYKKMAKAAEHLQNTSLKLQKEANFLEKEEDFFILKTSNNLLKHLANGFVFSEEPTEVDLKKTVQDILSMFQPILHDKFIQLTVEIPEETFVSCDALSLKLVLYNILELLTDGFFKNHQLLIRFKAKPHLELQFQEDGFALKAPQSSTSTSGFLGFSRDDLCKFVNSMGCSLSFESNAKALSVTSLFSKNQQF